MADISQQDCKCTKGQQLDTMGHLVCPVGTTIRYHGTAGVSHSRISFHEIDHVHNLWDDLVAHTSYGVANFMCPFNLKLGLHYN